MRTFSKLATSFWTNDLGRELRAHGQQLQLLALYLISNKHSNYSGIYVLPKMYIAADLGIEMGSVDAMLRTLDEMNYAKYDESAEAVWIINAAREQLGESLKSADKMVKAVQRELSELPKKCVLTAGFMERYAEAYHLKADAEPAKRMTAAKVEAPEKIEAPVRRALPRTDSPRTQETELIGEDLPAAIEWFTARKNTSRTDSWLSDEYLASKIAYMSELAPAREVIAALREADKAKDYALRKLPAVFDAIYNDV